MLFVTTGYLVFFIAVFLGFWLLPAAFRFYLLLFASFYFYGTWSLAFLFHLILIVAINYYGMEIWKKTGKNFLFYVIIVIDILNIALFKYFYFFADVLAGVFSLPYLQEENLKKTLELHGLKIFLPLGISFYTFQILSYSYDIYRGKYRNRHTFAEVLLYILFFPQLIAGPIMRAEELLPQLQKVATFTVKKEYLQQGFWLILSGVFKKLIIADNLSFVVAPLYQKEIPLVSLEVWLLVFSALLMLYADFSAYSDIARGCGYFLGITIPVNFKAPFFMISISDFWRRWHLTFSMWIRDYIYIPLGGSRVPEWRHYANLIFTFFLGGLWHGASYNFVVWGLLMGMYLSVEAFFFKRGIKEYPVHFPERLVRRIISWFLLLLSGAFFFIQDFERALYALKKMIFFDGKIPDFGNAGIIAASFVYLMVVQYIEEHPEKAKGIKRQGLLQLLFFLFVLLSLLEFTRTGKDFFYFQF